ncbi:DUF262 domain-containing protein [Actinoalloteichus hymeniacidonis]|uniref:DUF262 domain-containing protein n=1 Tax=Actinoalloteichus hymeniacidonis TaxID=340345 RepID=A0AAC9HRZ2_9PSEU|nr:DUF262 domain-containing protein [Actinoalloteichus hymeniacidonis]AOS64106.1 hypothetical protein TL08_16530 [Actinoalloteichus hymeniacidonis]MBB5907830.1 alkylated DNA nucleotide flippase Atl1 [Actinoalloteichus hymeniacidonis]
MKANETKLRDLLQGERQYLIPLYQRRYSWERKDLQQLWSDLSALLEDDTEAAHFMGSVVLAPSPTNTAAGVQGWIVVDGQQRLTTLSILLCAIRDHVRGDDPKLAEKIDDLYLFNKYAADQECYTLLPTQADRQAWISLLEQAPDAGGEDRIGQAYRYFRSALVAFDDPDDPHDIARIEQAIAGRLSIVEIAAHRDDNVHRIFESLNYTGQPLTQADLLRNYLFMRLPTQGEDVYRRQWLPLQELLSNKQLEELVWLDLVLRGDDRATQESVYQAQQQRLDALDGEAPLVEWITELHRKARLFRAIIEPSSAITDRLRQALGRLDRWGAGVVRPIALRILLAHDDGRLSDHEASDALRVVESYLVRRMITRIGSTGSNRVLMSLVKEIGEETPTAAAITKALSGPRKKFPTDRQLRDAVLTNNFYWAGRGTQRTFVLRSLEEDHRHGEPVDFDKSGLTIEHVLPQSLTEEWRQMLVEGAAEDETPEDLHGMLVHTLGNLSLTAYNAKLANDGFTAKKKILADSGLRMNREIASSINWGATEIRHRARGLAERAVRIWPGPDESAIAAPTMPQWRLMTQILASIPAGRWTSFSDVAEVIGSSPNAVSARLTSVPTANAHRVLKVSGEVSADFRWPDPAVTEDPIVLLQSEGLHFSESGRAAAAQRISAAELARLIDLDTDVPEVTGGA